MWIKTESFFMPVDSNEAEWEMLKEEERWERYSVRPFRVRIDRIEAYNESFRGLVTIRLENGESWMINKTVAELDKILGI